MFSKRSSLLVVLAGLFASGCNEPGKADQREAENPPAQARYAVIDVVECVDAASLGAGTARISDRDYDQPSLSAASVLGVSRSGDCIVIARIARAEEQSCLIDMRIRVEESESRVVVRRETRRRRTPVERGACSLDLTSDLVAIQLREPVGDREIVDAITL